MKQLILILILSISFCSCSMGVNQLTNEVEEDIQQTYNQENLGIIVNSLILTHEEGNYYIGILETSEPDGNFSYNVDVVYDGNSFVWEVY